jgi:hypothetical protein
MRQFIAACCCAIVGLEVLIAVPLVTCLVVLGVIGGVDVDSVATNGPRYSDAPLIPAPMVSSAALQTPSLVPPLPSGAPAACVQPPGWPVAEIESAPEVPAAASVAAAPATVGPQVDEIAEICNQVGSPLAASSLAGDSSATLKELIAALNRVAKEDMTPIVPSFEPTRPTEPIAILKPDPAPADQTPAAAENVDPGACPKSPATTCPENHSARPALLDSLQVTAELLYGRAQALEIDGNFDRADHLRGLARDIRREIDVLRHESSGPTPAPGPVTAASYDAPLPEEPAKLDADHASATAAPAARALSPSPASLQPTRATLVERSPVPPPLTLPQPPTGIQEEVELLLPEAQKVPENPAP